MIHKVHFYKSFHAKVRIIFVIRFFRIIFVISITIRNVDKSLELQKIRPKQVTLFSTKPSNRAKSLLIRRWSFFKNEVLDKILVNNNDAKKPVVLPSLFRLPSKKFLERRNDNFQIYHLCNLAFSLEGKDGKMIKNMKRICRKLRPQIIEHELTRAMIGHWGSTVCSARN